MSLDASRLKTAIRAAILSNVPSANDTNGAVTELSSAIATAIVDEITGNLDITLPAASFGVNAPGSSPNTAVTCTVA